MSNDPKRASGGYTEVAAALSKETGMAVTRQRVWVWWSRRARNGFPEGWKRVTYSGGGVRRFYVDDVLTWYRESYSSAVTATSSVAHATGTTEDGVST